jgi:hypothetical protein
MLKPAHKVRGYQNLSEHDKKTFAEFLANFYRAWEFPEKHIPISVKPAYDEGAGEYLRVEFNEMWLHVKSPTVWF